MKALLVTVTALMISTGAMADNVGVYSDCTGSSCTIASGFSSTTAVVHKYSLGATLSRWKIVPPVGSNVVSFTPSAGFNAIGNVTSDIAVAYGQCMQGAWCVGTFTAVWTLGTIDLTAADLQPSVWVVECTFGPELPATGSDGCVGPENLCCPINATEQSTWGGVKALYR